MLIARPDARPTGDAAGRLTPVRWVERVDHRLIALLTVLGFGVPIVVYFWVVHHFGLNTIWIDQWSDLGVISHAYSGHLTLSTLWAQHTENRILFPNLVVLLLAHTTHFNIVDEEFLSAIVLVLSIGSADSWTSAALTNHAVALLLSRGDPDALGRSEREHALGVSVCVVSRLAGSQRYPGPVR